MAFRRDDGGLFRGAAWTIGASLGARVLSLVGTLLLTRHIAPQDYGTVSVAMVFIATVGTMVSLGLGQYVVSHPRAGEAVTTHASVLHIGLGGIAVLLAIAVTGMAERHLAVPGLAAYVPALLVASVLERVGYLPGRVLARDMHFRPLVLRQVAGELVYVTVALGSAWSGHGAWALVHAAVTRSAVTTAMLITALPLRAWLHPARPSMDTVRSLARFGIPMSLANTLHWLSRRGDNLLMAALLGPAAAGRYSLAYNLADIPATHIGEPIGDVLLPALARTPSVAERHLALRRALRVMALVVFPLASGLGAVAPTLVRAWFARPWWDVGPMLVVLSALSILRPVTWLLASYLQAVHQPRALLLLESLKVVVLVSALLALARLGAIAACGAIGIAFAAHWLASAVVLRRLEGLRLRALVAPTLSPLLGCCALVLVVLSARLALNGSTVRDWVRLSIEIACGAAAYLTTIGCLAREDAMEVVALARHALRRRIGTVPSRG